MKLCLITNSSIHHCYWINELGKKYELGAVIMVNPKPSKSKIKNGVKKFGWLWVVIKSMSVIYNILRTKKQKQLDACEIFEGFSSSDFFTKFNDSLLKCDTINDLNIVNYINKLNVDVICFLGGDIARSIFLDNVNSLILNFHSGISPIYNGSATTYNAIANNNIPLCGGTLMVMNKSIDGGEILSHYFTKIIEHDNEETIFYRGIIGAVKLYIDFIEYYSSNKKFFSIEQKKPLLYYRSNDWGIFEDLKLKYYSGNSNLKKYVREEKIFSYYKENITIHEMYSRILSHVLH